MSFASFLRSILPQENQFYDLIEQQAAVAQKAAHALTSFKTGAKADVVRVAVQELEHEGDRLNHAMLDELGRTFSTPLDRDDLQKLSKRLDDITDYANAAARACALFGVEQPTRPMLSLVDKLLECAKAIEVAVHKLRRHDYKGLMDDARHIGQLEKDCDQVYRTEMGRLFHDPAVDAKTILREREVLDELESAVNHCEQVADLLTAIAVKHA